MVNQEGGRIQGFADSLEDDEGIPWLDGGRVRDEGPEMRIVPFLPVLLIFQWCSNLVVPGEGRALAGKQLK